MDGDGLTIAAEIANETSPMLNDTDGDGLSDYAEVVTHGTNPTNADTDGDGLPDAEELDLPTDPTIEDTDGDGVLDGNETFTTTAKNESLGVTVELTGKGNVSDGVTVDNQTAQFARGDRVGNLSASEIVRIESEREFESANVTIEYDDSLGAANNESDLTVVTYDPEKQLYVPLDSTVDRENNTVTAETEHFSTFAVFSISNWAEDVTAHRPPKRDDAAETVPVDIVFVIDSSGSMQGNDPKNFRKQAATKFVGALIPGDRAGVVDFDSSAHVDQRLTTGLGAVNASIRSLDASGGTHIGNGLKKANQHFESQGNDSRPKIAILLTDGQGQGGREEARTAAERNVTVHTIGFGNANGNKLSDIAAITDGTYNYVDDASDLPDAFSRVTYELDSKDSDGDGLPDVLEKEGIPIGHTGLDKERIETDPHDPDTDGDGVTDGQEVGPLVYDTVDVDLPNGGTRTVWITYRRLHSDPTEVDSDGDGLTDLEEREGWNATLATTPEQGDEYAQALREDPSSAEEVLEDKPVTSNPLVADGDQDGLDDLIEYVNRLDPLSSDSDGDTIPDAKEYYGRDQSSRFKPAIHDHEAPTVMVRSVVTHNTERTAYSVRLKVTDESGVIETELRKKGKVQDTIRGDGKEAIGYRTVSFTINRSRTEKIVKGIGGFVSASRVKIESRDVHGNRKRQTFYGPDSYGQAADKIGQAPIPHDVGKRELILVMGFSSGTTGAGKQAVMDLADLVRHPADNLEQMGDLAGYIYDNPKVAKRIPGMMAEQVKEKQRTRNPFVETGPKGTFSDGWYVGYVTGTSITMVVGDKGAGAVVSRLTSSSTRIGRAMRAVKAAKTSLKASVTTKTMALAGRVVRKSPDVDIDTGKVANQLSDLSKPARHRTTRQLTNLKDESWRVIQRNDYEGQAVKVLRTGKKGRRALDALGATGKRYLLKHADDVATERAIINAWERGDISTREMASALRRFDELDAAERQAYKNLARQTGDDAVEVLAKSDGPARRVAADGGVDNGFRIGIARAADSKAVDSFDQIDDVVRKIEELDGPANRRAKLLVYDTDGAEVKLVDELDGTGLRTLFKSVDSRETLARLSPLRRGEWGRSNDRRRYSRFSR